LGFAIFGITEVPTDGVEFDATDFAYAKAEAGIAPQATFARKQSATTALNQVYVPPEPEPAKATSSQLSEQEVGLSNAHVASTSEKPIVQDLLDDADKKELDSPNHGEIHDLD